MKKTDLKRHLSLYSIYGKRYTTINHAFASAISYFDDYHEKEIVEALKLLDQNPNSELKCVYCNKKAESWDHLESLVKQGMYTGNGHQIGNLVPCCKKCNSSKGKKNYIDFVNTIDIDEQKKLQIIDKLTNYRNNFRKNIIDINSKEYADVTLRYFEIKNQIFELMKLADEEANKIRKILKHKT